MSEINPPHCEECTGQLPFDADEAKIKMTYTNYRGEVSQRTINPHVLYFGTTTYHPEPQWLLEARDIGKRVIRVFALKDCDFTSQGEE